MRTTAAGAVDELIARGIDAQQRGDAERAESCYREAIEADALDVRARQLLGALLAERDRADEAVEVLTVATALIGALQAHTTAVYNNLGNALRLAKRRDEAEAVLREVVAVAPDQWEAWHNLGQVYKDAERHHEAAACLRRAVALAPGHGPNHAVLGQVLHALGRLRSADAALRRCIALGWDTDVNLWTVLGNNHRYLGEMPQAIEALEHAVELSAGSPSALSNLAIVMTAVGRFDDALALYDRAIEIEPDSETWLANRGYARLAAGVLPDGWVDWEHGIVNGGARGSERKLGVPRWTPGLEARRVLCYREQGVGDEILFLSVLGDLVASVPEVVYECDRRLVSLLARSFPRAEVRATTNMPLLGEATADCDASIPVGSLPMHFRPTAAHFPRERRGYLVPDPARVARWRARFDALHSGGPVVAVSWRSRIRTAERRLEYTRLVDDWGPIFAVPGVTWVNVQYDDCERELRDAERAFGVTIHRFDDVDYMNDFEEVAAIMSACDLVVAPRNAVAMLAGALGVPTVMMGNRWDWSDLGTDTSPWFPSVQLVYRHFGEEWDDVIATAAARVASVARMREGHHS